MLRGFLFLLFVSMIVSEIRAREAIRPATDVEQVIKDLEDLHVDTIIERGPPCTLDVQKDLPRPNQVQPLYLRPHTSEYWLPNGKGQLQIPRGASIELHCTKSFANVSATANTDEDEDDSDEDAPLLLQVAHNTRSISARCLHDRTFEWVGGKHELRHFVCKKALRYSVERLQQQCGEEAGGQAHLYRVGYNISDQRFITTMEICHDASQLRTHYTHHRLVPASVHFQRQVKRTEFSQAGHFTGYNMHTLYSQRHQMEEAAQLLGASSNPGNVGGLFDVPRGLFLSRGHLAAKADLIYASQQRSTFNYLNVAPQWQIFNGGQWLAVEDETRKFVARGGLNVSVYTGTWGVMSMPGSEGSGFFLARDANNNGVLPVPLLFYRVLIDSVHPWRGIALVGVNNPFATQAQFEAEYVICEPVQELVAWLRWLQNRNLSKGYLYACTVADLARAVAHLPAQLSEVHELLV
ncbi:uncharacterized protein LOC115622863 [Scaptodrosophila lebanonensis]|uniref:Uncharacterized protein LOC115622863 n=1 Tax=Drosophila lebanonensis TaxID=7225 RepID=A0A6J2TCF9_DROLE|nr:uncharacterized protein LOC115622863 [Scaptodrosophila lebanonensis]